MHRYLRLIPLLFGATLLAWGGVTPALSAGKIGVVLMHGKTGTAKSRAPIGPLIAKLKHAGILVVAPDMPWSRSRFLAKDYEGSMAEIDVAVSKLKRMGAKKIVVAGHSMGGNAAIGYGARRDGLAGIIAIAPGHDPGHYGFQKRVKFDYKRAKAMVDKGRGNAFGQFADTNVGKFSKERVKASIYLDWYDPDGPAAMKANAAKLKADTPFLCIYGKSDPLLSIGRPNACDPAPKNPKSRFLLVDGGHINSPRTAAGEIIAWIKGL